MMIVKGKVYILPTLVVINNNESKKKMLSMLAALNYIWERTKFLYFPCRSRSLYFRKLSCSIMAAFSTFGLYRNLETILDDLTDSKHNNVKPVQELLRVFNDAKQKFEEQGDVKKYPLIILEGLDGSGKSAMTRGLAKKIQAEKCRTPPESIKSIRPFFDDNLTLRTAYYSLGNYIAALEVSCILSKKPVVMDRFWHSTTAFALAQGVANNCNKLTLPHSQDLIYKWPSDLLKPDIVLLLNVSEEVRLERHSRRNVASVTAQEKLLNDDTQFRQDVLQAYRNMREPGVVLVDGNGSIGRTLYLLTEQIKPLVN